MPSFVSKLGVWEPAKEKTVIIGEDGSPKIYEGPDRAAKEFLEKENVSKLGMDAKKDPDNIMRARQLGMSVEEFLRLNEPPSAETLKAEEAKKTMVVDHADPKRQR
jgi:hypothetical protein